MVSRSSTATATSASVKALVAVRISSRTGMSSCLSLRILVTLVFPFAGKGQNAGYQLLVAHIGLASAAGKTSLGADVRVGINFQDVGDTVAQTKINPRVIAALEELVGPQGDVTQQHLCPYLELRRADRFGQLVLLRLLQPFRLVADDRLGQIGVKLDFGERQHVVGAVADDCGVDLAAFDE